MQRLFFALWPSPEDCDELLRRAKTWLGKANGRAVARENLHLTLAFLGNVSDSQLECVHGQVANLDQPAFSLCFDRLAYWPKPRVAWVGAEQTPSDFIELAKALKAIATDCGLVLDSRPPVAHLTLKRKVTQAPPMENLTPLCWQVDRFYLVKSTTFASGPVYERLAHWPLR